MTTLFFALETQPCESGLLLFDSGISPGSCKCGRSKGGEEPEQEKEQKTEEEKKGKKGEKRRKRDKKERQEAEGREKDRKKEKSDKERCFCKRMNFRVPLDQVINVPWKRSPIKNVTHVENNSQLVSDSSCAVNSHQRSLL